MKRLILLFDGTWKDDRDASSVTNIFCLRQLLEKANRETPPGVDRKARPPIEKVEQRIYYDEGVGAHDFDRLLGGVFGLGLSENIRQGYRFLSQFYGPGDEIYIFGFSRGAFTARSLVGFVAASGLLTKRHCDEPNLAFAWNYYRTPPKKRFPADKGKLEKLCSSDVRINSLACSTPWGH